VRPRPGAAASRRRHVGGWGTLVVTLTLAAVLAGCGESVTLPDLFLVTRTGGAPGERLTVLVNEGGTVHCDGGRARQLSDPQLIQARSVTEELQSPSAKHLSLPPRPGSVFHYYVRDAEGWVRFADNSADQPSVLHHLALLVLEVQQQVCHLPVG
jgi:hypothetical protein